MVSIPSLDFIKSPEDLLEYLKGFGHDFRYSTNLSNIDFDYVVDQYFCKGSLPSFTFAPLSFTLESRRGSCYDLALLSCKVLMDLGFSCDIFHFGWTPKKSSSLSILSCMHTACRFWVGGDWYLLQGFLYRGEICILGPFSSLEAFIKEFSFIILRELKRDNISITFIDSLGFGFKEVPISLSRLYPVVCGPKPLGYWIV